MVRKMMLGIHKSITPSKSSKTTTNTTANTTAEPPSQEAKSILCYGDSLTAGMSSGAFQMSPYAPHLERALSNGTVVRHRGNPGWSAVAMVNSADNPRAGLRSAIQEQKPDLVIIMAGTNDLGRHSRVGKTAVEQRAASVAKPIQKLHQIAWDAGVPHTVAIAVPPSGFQASVAGAAALANSVNQQLEAFCKASNGKATYVPFPFEYERNGKYWSSDTLHFSPAGYKFIGESLAAKVSEVLATQEEEEAPEQKEQTGESENPKATSKATPKATTPNKEEPTTTTRKNFTYWPSKQRQQA